jgi:hypothetical protein
MRRDAAVSSEAGRGEVATGGLDWLLQDQSSPQAGWRRRPPERPLFACAVTRRRFPVGASPTRRPLQPEATGVRQLLDEPDRVRDEHPWLRLRLQRAHRRVKRREELVRDQHLTARERLHERRLPCVRVPDQRDPEKIATRGPPLVVVSLDILELLFQLCEAIADLAAIEIEIGLARAGAPLAPAARRRLPQARRNLLQPCNLDLQPRLAAVRMTMEDLHDHAGPIEHLRSGCALEVACLARRDLVIDDHELRLWGRVWIRLDLRGFRLLFVGILKALARLRLLRDCHRSADARPAGDRPELCEPPLAEHCPAVDPVALLRHRAGDLVTECLYQTAQFLDARGVRDVVDAWQLDANEDGPWHGCAPAATGFVTVQVRLGVFGTSTGNTIGYPFNAGVRPNSSDENSRPAGDLADPSTKP